MGFKSEAARGCTLAIGASAGGGGDLSFTQTRFLSRARAPSDSAAAGLGNGRRGPGDPGEKGGKDCCG